MPRRLVDLSLDNLPDLPLPCRHCVFWELDPVSRRRAEGSGDPPLEKEAWISATLLDWGSCGKVCYVDGQLAGFAVCAPASRLPRAAAFPTSPISQDAVLLSTLHVLPAYAGAGLGKALVQGIAKQVLRRPGVKAIEAFGDTQWERAACLVPADYLEAIGFQTIRAHRRYPRLRLDLRTALSWRAEVEGALERLREAVRPETSPRPVPAARATAAGTRRP